MVDNFELIKPFLEFPNDDTCAEEIKGEKPRWVVDIDDKIAWSNIMDFIDTLEPYSKDTKFITNIPTKSGWYLITTPFNIAEFKKAYPDIDVYCL